MSLMKKRRGDDETPSEEMDWLSAPSEGELALDVFREDGTLVIRAPMAGVAECDVDVAVDGDLLTIRGTRKQSHEVNEDDWFLRECYWGSFSRSVVLPHDVDASRAKAHVRDGLLEVRLPIRGGSRRIEVSSMNS